jgi:hypothetical protein
MVVYLDLLFLFDFAVNGVLLYVIQIIYREKVSIMRIFLGSLIGGMLIFVFMLDYYVYYFTKAFGGIAVGLMGFKKDRLIPTILKIASFYLVSLASVGLVSSFRISEWYLFLVSLMALIIIVFLENSKKPIIFSNSLKYNISVHFSKKSYHLEGYLDTGNFSKNEDLPIVYLSKRYKTDDTVHKIIGIRTVNGISWCDSYKPKSFSIEINHTKVEKEVLIVFSDLSDFDCLLNTELFL